ncbi:MAG: TonB family protein [Holophagales bacterium]|nr:TonB family protein [Holophagales bacterium]
MMLIKGLKIIVFANLFCMAIGSGEPDAPLIASSTNSIGVKFALAPAFSLDSNIVHTTNLRPGINLGYNNNIDYPFYISQHEVTLEQWERVMGGIASSVKISKLPVKNVSWKNAVRFCKKLSLMEKREYRLPTEMEWEYVRSIGNLDDDFEPLNDYPWQNRKEKKYDGGFRIICAVNKLQDQGVGQIEYAHVFYDKELSLSYLPPKPPYPLMARLVNQDASVTLAVVIGADGLPDSLRVIDGPSSFQSTAIEYVKQWRFNPATVHGQPVAAAIFFELPFSLTHWTWRWETKNDAANINFRLDERDMVYFLKETRPVTPK